MADDFNIIVPDKLPKDTPEQARLKNIIDMALGFTSMVRVFKKGAKEQLHEQCLKMIPEFGKVNSKAKLDQLHREFCEWGVDRISTTDNKPASYGQIGKTLNVILHVAIHFCHYPNCDKAKEITPWLDAAIDTKMMRHLKKHCQGLDINCVALADVDKNAYIKLQKAVVAYDKECHRGKITPVQYDDLYWRFLNRDPESEKKG